jgi:hypothetical protein
MVGKGVLCKRYLEQLERDRVFRVWSVQCERADARMGRQRLKKCFMSVDSGYEPQGCEWVLLDGLEERCAKRVDDE